MKFLKYLFFLILLVLIAGTIFFATKNGKYDIKDSIEIDAPVSLVFDTVNDYKTWTKWAPYEDDPATATYAESTSGVGATHTFQGEMPETLVTTAVVEDVSIDQDITILTPGGERYAKTFWTFESLENGNTKVTWRAKGEHTLMDKVYFTLSGTDFEADIHELNEKGLQGLAAYVRAEMEKFEVTLDGVTEYAGGFYLYKTSSASNANMSMIMGQNYGAIMSYMEAQGISQAGMPFTIYESFAEQGAVMSNAIPVKERIVIATDANILTGYQPLTKAVKVTLKGNYTHLPDAWAQAMEYVEQYELVLSEQKPFEVYTNDPGDFPNPADWVTEIYVPIQ